MKILVICQYYYPENFQITPICEQLVQNGHEVTVLTGLPNYGQRRIYSGYRKGHRDETVNGVHVLRCHLFARKKSPVSLAINYLSFVLSSSARVLKINELYDVVFVYQLSPVLMAVPGEIYAKRHGIPEVIYCCDLWPESLKMYIKSEHNVIFKFLRSVSKHIYNFASHIIVQSDSFVDYLTEVHGISEKCMTYLPAFADEMYLSQDFTGQNSVIDFVFLGNLGMAQDLISVLRAIDLIKSLDGFKVHFVGDGTVLDEMKRFVSEHDIGDKVYFYGRRPVEDMPIFYRLADVCIVSLNSDNLTGLTLPSKVQGYMAAGKPIIGMVDGSAKAVIEEARCGICVPSGDVESFAQAMKSFIMEYDRYKECGDNGRAYFKQHFRKETFIKQLENILERTEV